MRALQNFLLKRNVCIRDDACVILGVLIFKATSTAVGDAGDSFNDRRCCKLGESLGTVPAIME